MKHAHAVRCCDICSLHFGRSVSEILFARQRVWSSYTIYRMPTLRPRTGDGIQLDRVSIARMSYVRFGKSFNDFDYADGLTQHAALIYAAPWLDQTVIYRFWCHRQVVKDTDLFVAKLNPVTQEPEILGMWRHSNKKPQILDLCDACGFPLLYFHSWSST